MTALVYLLSPATLIFECELFYTSTISLLLLVSVFYLIRLTESGKGRYAFGFIFPHGLALPDPQCISYFLVDSSLWLSLLFYFRKKAVLYKP